MSEVRSQDLVLVVSEQSDFDLGPYERFLDQLTAQGGGQQNEALHIAARYLLGGRYADLFALAAENWEANEKIREHHEHNRANFMDAQQLGPLLAGSIDHATATGKSYVIFGAAVLALASGQVDRVLVLCPSRTIEDGLTGKFTELAAKAELMDLLPDTAAVRVPAIVNAYEATVPTGAICVENIHAAYEGSASSIRDSFTGQGSRALIVNDEAHHIYRTRLGRSRDPKEWANFLLDEAFGFRRVLNVSGTCFIDDAYFPDVIHRYSLQQARDDRKIKAIHYWEADRDFPSYAARWRAVLDNHEDNQRLYTGAKPITIFVTDKVARASDIHVTFTSFLANESGVADEVAAERTLIVSSAPEHTANLSVLRTVDAPSNRVEFIFSVSMLTEGWDVKNVLQIVPHEKRAFDSKLLISQVLGRGLRLLPGYPEARVVVFNHAKWAPEMRRLFDDVWLDEQRIHATPIAGNPHHFALDLLKVERGLAAVPAAAAPTGRAAGEGLRLAPQHATTTVGALIDMAGRRRVQRYRYDEPTAALDDFVATIEATLSLAAIENGEEPDTDSTAIGAEIEAAMRAAAIRDDQISESNQARVWDWLAPPVKSGRRVAVQTIREELVALSTADMAVQGVGRSELNRETTIALRTDNDLAIRWPGHDSGQYGLLDQIVADQNRRHGAVTQVTDERTWRTPLDVVIVSHGPERAFLDELLHRPAACSIDDWVKSPDSGFHPVPFTLAKAGVTRNAKFNPDWFLRRGDHVLVVETKADGDASDENRAKLAGASEWFSRINAKLAEAGSAKRYFFCFLGQSDIAPFFDAVCDGSYQDFLSNLQEELA